MAVWHAKSNRKSTGSKLSTGRKKRQFEKGREPTHTTIGDKKTREVRLMGGQTKKVLRQDNKVNYVDPATKKALTTPILEVMENKSNPQFIKNNIITKGAVVKTKAGKIRITSRPGQDGQLNGILLEQKS